MTTTIESTETNNKQGLTLNEDQLNNLMSLTGMSEETISEMLEQAQNFPSGGITEAEFITMNNDRSHDSSPKKSSLLHLIFDTIDHDHSGKIDIYEYILTVGLLSKTDPDASIKCLFKLCDANHDGFLTQVEVANLLSIFFLNVCNEAERQENEGMVEMCMDSVKKAFGNKTHISEQELRKICAEDEDIQELAQSIHAGFVMALAFSSTGFA